MDTAVMEEPDPFVSDEELAARARARQLAPGTCIHGKYVVHGTIGQGGFAVVYDAQHLGLARPVAIKVLHLQSDTPLALIERFHREARLSAMVRHPNVLEVYDTGLLPDGSPYLVMERLRGETLSALIARGPLSLASVIEIGYQLLQGVAAIGEAGILHRDIKPDNVMVHRGDGAPQIKLVDFGISRQLAIEASARLTCNGALIGTPQYMSPEQIRGEELDARSDLYAVGAVLYEALTGHAPHESTNFSELVVAILNNPVTPVRELRPNCPLALQQVVLRALTRTREHRYASPEAALLALDRVAEELGLARGQAAFAATDPVELASDPQHVGARDTGAFVHRFWPLRPSATRPLRLGLLATLILGAQSAMYLHVASRGADPRPSRVSVSPLATSPAAASASPTPAGVPTVTPVELPSEAAPRALKPLVPTPHVEHLEPVVESLLPVGELPPRAGLGEKAWLRAMQAAEDEVAQGRLVPAQQRYLEAVRVDPREAAGFRGLGVVSADLGDVLEARKALTRYLELAPHASDAEAMRARLAALQ